MLSQEKNYSQILSKRKESIQQQFIERTLETASPTQAYREIYPNTKAHQEISEGAFRILKTPEVKNSITETLDKSGLTVGYLNNRLKSLTVAEKHIVFNNQLVPVADNSTSLDAVKTAYKLHKLLDESNFVNVDARSVNIDIDLPTIEKIDVVVNKLDTLNKRLELSKTMTGDIEEDTPSI